jgi:hypothetical protein
VGISSVSASQNITYKKPSGQPGLSGTGRFRFGGGVLYIYCCGALPAAASAAAFESAEIAPLGLVALLLELTWRVR